MAEEDATLLGLSSSAPSKNQSLPSNYLSYPEPLAEYEQVVASPQVFMSSLEKLHFVMGTKFMIPTIGGKELDLHRLFVEVTSRGGVDKILKERRWKEVTAVFNFPSTATNASFVLRKYYGSLLHHYEQIYYFKARRWINSPSPETPNRFPASVHGLDELNLPVIKQRRIGSAEFSLRAGTASSSPSGGPSVIGVIDGKFDSGYLVTVAIGSEKLKGVLYQAPPSSAVSNQTQQYPSFCNNGEKVRRRRRKKSEMKRRDPAHPKPNRSGYNFFFAEQHARLKLLHPGKDRQISRTIGELWTKLNDDERKIYREKAIEDKERYRVEMEGYREKQKMVISNAVPIQQRLPEPRDGIEGIYAKSEVAMEEGDSPYSAEGCESSSGKTAEAEEDDNGVDKDLETSAEAEGFELRKRVADIAGIIHDQ